MRLEGLVGASPNETRSLENRLDVVADGFLSLKDSHKKHVAETATCFSKILDDMMLGALKEKLNDVELEISLVKKVVAGSAHGPDVSHKVKPKSFGAVF